MSISVLRKTLVGICIVNGISALICGFMMILVPDGSLMGMPPSMLSNFPGQELFFRDFRWPGIALLLVNGIPNTIAASLMLLHRKSGFPVGLLAGCLLICWCLFEMIFLFNTFALFYLAVGVVQAALGLYLIKHQTR